MLGFEALILRKKNTLQSEYNIAVLPVSRFCENMQTIEKTDVINLPLSLEDNSTLLGQPHYLKRLSKNLIFLVII